MKINAVNYNLAKTVQGGNIASSVSIPNYTQPRIISFSYFKKQGLSFTGNTLRNKENLYVEQYDLSKNNLKSMLNAAKLIYSKEAKNKMFKLLEKFKPDLIILNNIEYHLTPSIILAIGKYKKNINKDAKLTSIQS